MNDYIVCDCRATPEGIGGATILDWVNARSTTQAIQQIGATFDGEGCSLWRKDGDNYVFVVYL